MVAGTQKVCTGKAETGRFDLLGKFQTKERPQFKRRRREERKEERKERKEGKKEKEKRSTCTKGMMILKASMD